MPVARIAKPINVKPVKKRFDGVLESHERGWPRGKKDDSTPVPDAKKDGAPPFREAVDKISAKKWREAKKKAGIPD